ncbi:cupin domain-containing protein [Mycolicibacterium palauense]|uniref:cupin domain-containing protein n=1 Tax=Mycolicibacterium palauense TaxID=2034511 RepID=UPI000BFEB4A2|nr:cupin domain-containing protein [Mycolicibacterium palauense]
MSQVMPPGSPYPPPRYTADDPKISARLRRHDTGAELTSRSGLRYHYLVTGAGTGGDYGLYRVDLPPASGGPGPHFHRTMSEAFFVLEGRMRLHDGNGWVDGDTGDFLYVPPGGIHGFANEADAPASILILFAPGAPREGYFEGLQRLAEMTDAERTQFFVDHDNFFVI